LIFRYFNISIIFKLSNLNKPFLDSEAYFIDNKVLNQVLYTAWYLELVGRIIKLSKDKTSLNNNTPNKITRGN